MGDQIWRKKTRKLKHAVSVRKYSKSTPGHIGNTVCWKAMAQTRTDDDSVTYWFLWKHPMARRRGLEFGVFEQTPRKWAHRLGPTGVVTRSSFLHKTTIAKHRLGPSGLAICLFRCLCTKTQPKCGLGPAGLAFGASQMHQAPIFAHSTSASRSLKCCAQLRPRWVYKKIQESHLIIPATSVGNECSFSIAGLILHDGRNLLTDIMFEQMLVAKLNGDLMWLLVRDMFIVN